LSAPSSGKKRSYKKEGRLYVSFPIENGIVKEREENNADVEAYHKMKAAEANTALYTQEYVSLEMAKNLVNNTKFYFSGETSPLGSLLAKLLN
jgi:hypothetical protein